MVLSAVVATLALALAQAEEPTSADEDAAPPPVEEASPPAPAPPQREPDPVEPPRTRAPNEDLRNGVVFSAERLFPLVTVQDVAPAPIVEPRGCTDSIRLPDCGAYDTRGESDAVQVGPTWDAARSLFDYPALAFDGAISSVTLGGSLVAGKIVGRGGGLEAGYGALGISPRIGYAVALGKTFALWPRLGITLAVSDSLKSDVNLLFVNAQLGALWFFTHHAAFSLTPALHAPMADERSNVRRFAVDLGLVIAF